MQSLSKPSRAELEKIRHILIRVAQISFLCIICVAVGYLAIGLFPDKRPAVATPPQTAWSAPASYTVATTNEDVAYGYRWLPKGEYKCLLFQRCEGIEVISSRSCPEAFAIEAVLLDKTGANIGKTTAQASIEAANEKTKLTLALDSADAVSVRIARTLCH